MNVGDVKGLKGQLDLKKASFWGLIPKIGQYWPLLATRAHL